MSSDMNIYIDESIHEKHGFMLLAYVICPTDPQEELETLLGKHKKYEYHSLEKMDGNNRMQILRSEIKQFVNWKCRWGVLVLPSQARWNLSGDLTNFLTELVNTHSLPQLVRVFLDEGIVKQNELNIISTKIDVKEIALCESHVTNGIQLADLVASISGVRLREEISQSPKMLTYGNESGFNPPIKAELGYELWADLRYSMSRSSEPLGEDMPEMAQFETKGYGFFISDDCALELRESAEKIFGSVYLGCIH